MGFTTQASIDPPRFIACLSHKNRTFREGKDAPALGVHAVPADAEDLAAALRRRDRRPHGQVRAHRRGVKGPLGVPILDRCENWFVGRVLGRVDAGDHDAFLLEPIDASSGDGEEFTFHRAKRIDPGHEA